MRSDISCTAAPSRSMSSPLGLADVDSNRLGETAIAKAVHGNGKHAQASGQKVEHQQRRQQREYDHANPQIGRELQQTPTFEHLLRCQDEADAKSEEHYGLRSLPAWPRGS